MGLLTRDALLDALVGQRQDETLGAIALHDYLIVAADTRLFDVIARMRRDHTLLAIVVERPREPDVDSIKGFITNERLAGVMVRDTALFTD
ncbi:MAG: hypothetical protein P8Y94_08570 [Acidobacteriota bacterium]